LAKTVTFSVGLAGLELLAAEVEYDLLPVDSTIEAREDRLQRKFAYREIKPSGSENHRQTGSNPPTQPVAHPSNL
jgi:hypothetical protein